LAVDLTGKNVIVTGANTGIGKETARVLALANATVFLACRDQTKAETAAEEIRQSTGKDAAHVRVLQLDLASFGSIKACAKTWYALKLPLHLLINNAGIMACPPSKTADGFELQYGANHLGHFFLTNLLLPSLKAAKKARIVTVSSNAASMSPVHFDVAGTEGIYQKGTWIIAGKWMAYGQSKCANILFASELQRRLKAENYNEIYSVSLHPGVIKTELGRHIAAESSAMNFLTGVLQFFGKSIEQGASTQVYGAVSPHIANLGGAFLSDCKAVDPPKHATAEAAKKLWELSERQVKLAEALKEVLPA